MSIKIENVEVVGWEPAIRGARNAMNSWDRSDSYWTHIEDPETKETAKYQYFVGPNDEKLMLHLSKAGTDHGKFMRFIVCYADVTGPFYWLKELDTYRAGVEKNSCSTMHKLTHKEFEVEDFSCEHLERHAQSGLDVIITWLNTYRNSYIESGEKRWWWQIIQLLPSSYNQRRTYMFSYAALRAIYHARKNHKLDEWHTFCEWIETLPFSDLITT